MIQPIKEDYLSKYPISIYRNRFGSYHNFLKLINEPPHYHKLTLEEMQKIAKEHGGKCLSNTYINGKTRMKWQCTKGHVWSTIADDIVRGTWCPFCAGLVKLTIEEMQTIALSKEGLCLSTEYINTGTKLKWKCKRGHVWESIPSSIKKGTWCPVCARNLKDTIMHMKKLASSKRGQCLSTEYINCKTRMKWQCDKGHKWSTVSSHIKNGTWCPVCARKKQWETRRKNKREY